MFLWLSFYFPFLLISFQMFLMLQILRHKMNNRECERERVTVRKREKEYGIFDPVHFAKILN